MKKQKKQKQLKQPTWEEAKVYEVEDIDAITDEIAKTLLEIDPASGNFDDAVKKLSELGPHTYGPESLTDSNIMQKIAQKIAKLAKKGT
mgnify:CR=1 FL=1